MGREAADRAPVPVAFANAWTLLNLQRQLCFIAIAAPLMRLLLAAGSRSSVGDAGRKSA